MSKYGITLAEYNRLRLQATHCPICGVELTECTKESGNSKTTKVLDHCHDDGQKIRGFICNQCNIALGGFRDDPALLDKAAAWIRQHEVFSDLEIAGAM